MNPLEGMIRELERERRFREEAMKLRKSRLVCLAEALADLRRKGI